MANPILVRPSPKDAVNQKNAYEFLETLRRKIPEPTSFIYFGDGSVPEITFVVDCGSFAPLFERALHTYYPNAICEPLSHPHVTCTPFSFSPVPHQRNTTKHTRYFVPFLPTPHRQSLLSPPAPLPAPAADRLASLFRLFESLEPEESLAFIANISPTHPDPEVTDDGWKDFLVEWTEGIKLRHPWQHLFFWVEAHFVVSTPARLEELTREMLHFLGCLPDSPAQFRAFHDRQVCDPLTADIIASLVHLPNSSIQSPMFRQADSRPKPGAPEFLTKEPRGGLVLGTNEHRKQVKVVALPQELRSRHLYVVGASGSGKSTLLANLIKQDLDAGYGFALVDPHGDLVTDVLAFIPKNRIQDVIYFNPAEREYVMPLNVLASQTPEEQELLADALIVIFRRLVESWGERMEYILRNSVYTLLEVGGKSFADIRRILVNPDFRTQVIGQLSNHMLLEFWHDEFPGLPKNATDPIVNKFSKFLSPLSTTRFIFSIPESKLNFATILQNRKIFLANLSQGSLGLDNAHLLGSFLISQLQLAAMRRASLPAASRTPFALYVDEFQNYTAEGSAFEKMLSEARKYNLQLVLAHQFTSQLSNKVADAIFGNVNSMVFFRVGVDDATYLQKAVSSVFTAEDLQNLAIGEAVMRAGRAEHTFNLKTYPPPAKPTTNFASAVIAHSRQHYSIPIKEAEERLRSQYASKAQATRVTASKTPEGDFWG